MSVTGGVAVIGLGSDLRGDDCAGLEVARRVRGRVPPEVSVLELHGESSGLLEAWRGLARAVIIDASRGGGPPGTVRRFEAAGAPLPAIAGGTSSHSLGLADAIELGRALGRLPTRLTVYAIEGGTFEPGAEPEEALAGAIEDVTERVVADLTRGP